MSVSGGLPFGCDPSDGCHMDAAACSPVKDLLEYVDDKVIANSWN